MRAMVQERPVRVERRLSAILAADVAGYSRLMHSDEEPTHAKLTALLMDAVNPAIAEHGGRIVKNTGDRGVTPTTLVHHTLVRDHVAVDRCHRTGYIADSGSCYRDSAADRWPIAHHYRARNLSSAGPRTADCDVSRSHRLNASRRRIGRAARSRPHYSLLLRHRRAYQ